MRLSNYGPVGGLWFVVIVCASHVHGGVGLQCARPLPKRDANPAVAPSKVSSHAAN
jgi:hypothetical protein